VGLPVEGMGQGLGLVVERRSVKVLRGGVGAPDPPAMQSLAQFVQSQGMAVATPKSLSKAWRTSPQVLGQMGQVLTLHGGSLEPAAGRTCRPLNELSPMHLTHETMQLLDTALARRFQILFPQGLSWDTAGLERLLNAGFGTSLNGLLRVVGAPLPSLSGVYLAQAPLVGSIIPGSDFSGANLSESDLEDVNLSRSDLNSANLHEARMLWTNLRGSNLQGANLSEAAWANGLLDLANLTGANLERASLVRAVAAGAIFTQSQMREVDLSWSNLIWADLREADLIGANLRGANLHGANLTGANLSGVNLADTIMTEVQLDGATLPDGWEATVWER